MRAVEEVEELLEGEDVVAALRYVFYEVGVRDHFLEDQDSVGEGADGDSEQADEQQDEAIDTLLGCAEAAGTAQGLIDFANDVDHSKGFGKHDGGGDRIYDERVTLSTIHRMKGLQAEEVYLLGCTEGLLPLAKADRDEEWRLGYVAFTRAKGCLPYLACAVARREAIPAFGPSRGRGTRGSGGEAARLSSPRGVLCSAAVPVLCGYWNDGLQRARPASGR